MKYIYLDFEIIPALALAAVIAKIAKMKAFILES